MWCLGTAVPSLGLWLTGFYFCPPVLFNIYIQPLGEVIQKLGLSCCQYPDDIQLYPMLPAEFKIAVQLFRESLGMIEGYQMKLNPNKI